MQLRLLDRRYFQGLAAKRCGGDLSAPGNYQESTFLAGAMRGVARSAFRAAVDVVFAAHGVSKRTAAPRPVRRRAARVSVGTIMNFVGARHSALHRASQFYAATGECARGAIWAAVDAIGTREIFRRADDVRRRIAESFQTNYDGLDRLYLFFLEQLRRCKFRRPDFRSGA